MCFIVLGSVSGEMKVISVLTKITVMMILFPWLWSWIGWSDLFSISAVSTVKQPQFDHPPKSKVNLNSSQKTWFTERLKSWKRNWMVVIYMWALKTCHIRRISACKHPQQTSTPTEICYMINVRETKHWWHFNYVPPADGAQHQLLTQMLL